MPEIEKPDYASIAAESGVDLDVVSPLSDTQRWEILETTLARTDVPFPIPAEAQKSYLEMAKSGKPFSVGPFGEETLSLGEYANEQKYNGYTFEEHLSWACLVAQQQKTKHQFACKEYLEGEEIFEIGAGVIPDFYLLNTRIYQYTQWQLATVNMIIPAELFFTCHSKRFFPVTTFMRPLGTDYLEEPDIGHDVACLLYTSPSPRDQRGSRMPSSA